MTKAEHEAAMEKQRLELMTMMKCGHPVAALNSFRFSGDRCRMVTTVYCRSCEIQAQKERTHV